VIVRISPSLLSADLGRLADQVSAASTGGADALHFDVMDGDFVPNITFGPVVLRAVRAATKLPIEAHLMVRSPERYLDVFAEAGADILTVHYEATSHVQRALGIARGLGARAGLALNPSSPVSLVEDLLPDVDLLLIMTVNPGFGGQRFIESMLPKVRRARALLDRAGSSAELEVDGGVTPTNAPLLCAAGATTLVAGSSLFGDRDVGQAIARLRTAAGGAA
jgi:ribulose-phosphate 3-epimerase